MFSLTPILFWFIMTPKTKPPKLGSGYSSLITSHCSPPPACPRPGPGWISGFLGPVGGGASTMVSCNGREGYRIKTDTLMYLKKWDKKSIPEMKICINIYIHTYMSYMYIIIYNYYIDYIFVNLTNIWHQKSHDFSTVKLDRNPLTLR